MAVHARAVGPAGPSDRPALRRCVAVDPATFAAEHWGRTPLLSRAGQFEATGGKGFDDLLSEDAVDELLSERGLRTPFLRVARDGAVLPPSRYTGAGGVGAEIADQVLDDRMVDLLADGATLVLQGLHRIWPPLIRFAVALRADLGQPVQANAYLTPPGNQAFATHYDTHDVFVLHCAGRKRWRVHPPVLADPLERQPWGGRADEVSARTGAPAVIDAVLEPGDALYLPRGWLHAAVAESERSLHLTVGIRAASRYTLVEELLGLATGHAGLRAGLPLGADLTDPATLEPELRATVAALRDFLAGVDVDALADRLRTRLWDQARPAPVRPLAQLDAMTAVDADTRLVPRAGLRWRLVEDGGQRARLVLTDRTVHMPAACVPAVRAVLGGTGMRAGELPGLDDADRLVLARRLLREAVVVVPA